MPAAASHDHYLDPYRRALASHGAGFDATLWSNRESQRLRFDVMIEMVNLRDCDVLDAGCGQGDLAARLHERDVQFRHLVGIDALADQVEVASRRGLARCEFHRGDFVHDADAFNKQAADWIVFSGSLNTMDEGTARGVIDAAFAATREGVAFNFLSDRVEDSVKRVSLRPARRFDTLGMIEWSFLRTHCVAFRQDYLDGHDATIVLRKRCSPPRC